MDSKDYERGRARRKVKDDLMRFPCPNCEFYWVKNDAEPCKTCSDMFNRWQPVKEMDEINE